MPTTMCVTSSRRSRTRDEHASHTELYLVVDHEVGLRIAAGQNVRT
jgi:hypothetical protein